MRATSPRPGLAALLFVGGLVTALPAGPAAAETAFTVSAPRPETHLVEIEMSVAAFPAPVRSFDLVMPSWIPGSYLVRDFARNVRDLSVLSADGTPLEVAKADKARWRVAVPGKEGSRGPFRVRYRAWAGVLSVRTSHLDATHLHGNGTSLFLYVEGRKDEPHALRFVLPEGWRVDVALPESEGLFRARDYDELVDSPFECGTHRTVDFEVRGVPHRVAVWGRGNEDLPRLGRELPLLVESAANLFGSLPYQRYLFILLLADGAGGGLEHRASQVCGLPPWEFRPEKRWREAMSLFSHELFHAWNVKRIRPAALGPFDYTREVYTRDLWAMEGMTSYYQWILLLRASLVPAKTVFEDWAKDLKEHREQPGAAVQSAEAASFDAWIRAYRPDENSPNVSESYYRRGALLGLALDLSIREATRGRRSLDDVFRWMWTRWGATGRGYPEGEWERAVRESTGWDPSAFFERYVRGTRTPAFEELFPAAGLVLAEKAEKADKDDKADKGDPADQPGKADGEASTAPIPRRADFGWKTRVEEGRLLVAEVYAGRPAYEAGVDAGDELVAVDGVKVDEEQLRRIERDLPPGSLVKIHLFRRGRLVELEMALGGRRAFTYEIRPDPAASPAAKALFTAWTGLPFPAGGDPPASPKVDRPEKLE